MKIENTKVFGIEDSFKASKYPMAIDVNRVSNKMTDTIKVLGHADIGSGHDNFLNGIVVQFDLTFSIKAWVEAERYHFLDFVSSQSTMHRITKMNVEDCCNEYVDFRITSVLQQLIKDYNDEPIPENFLYVIYNIPTGFELTARMTTNYRQLKTIYKQRRNHRLPDWQMFCDWIEELPYFKELCMKGEEK